MLRFESLYRCQRKEIRIHHYKWYIGFLFFTIRKQFIFYDLSEKKHADYIRALKIRAVVQNYKNNELSEDDVASLKDIIDFANENNNQFVLGELDKHLEIKAIFESKTQAAE